MLVQHHFYMRVTIMNCHLGNCKKKCFGNLLCIYKLMETRMHFGKTTCLLMMPSGLHIPIHKL